MPGDWLFESNFTTTDCNSNKVILFVYLKLINLICLSSTPSFGGYHKLATASAGLSPANISGSSSGIYVPVQQPQQYVPGSSLLSSNQYSGHSTTGFKMAPYGTLPEGIFCKI
jgi:hypothetical protein